MMTTRFPALVCVAWAMFALPAAAQTADGTTPANEGVCDPLRQATPGLYGLCVGMCEAQDCKATYDPYTHEVTFDESCNPSAEELLANYNNIAKPWDPEMPCVETACACWSEAGIDDIGGAPGDLCFKLDTFAGLLGSSPDGGGTELAYATDHPTKGRSCISIESTPPANTDGTREKRGLSAKEYAKCRQSVLDECAARGM